MNDNHLDSLRAYAEANAIPVECPVCGNKFGAWIGMFDCGECESTIRVEWINGEAVTTLVDDAGNEYPDCPCGCTNPSECVYRSM